jgi:predicted ATPase
MQESPSEVVTPPTAVASGASTVTFLFTDIEGSTGLWETRPDEMSRSLARHDAILRRAVESNGGQVVKTTGDGLFAAFGSAQDAIAGAVAGQGALGQASWESIGPLRVRMGLHTGDAVLVEDDYHGPAVNRAARLTTAGHGGQVLVSGATAALVTDRLPANVELVALGEHRLRDLGRPEVLYQLVHPDLARAFPPLRTLDSYPGNLPLPVSSFVGRHGELARVVKALHEARVVTLTGVGGVGKTRLALRAAAEVLPRFREGAWLVELQAVRDPGGVAEAVAAVFGVTARAGMSVQESVIDFLRTKQLLLVVDNCEHLLDAVADLVEALERSCAGLVVLATSREGLALDGERVVPVPTLSAPAPGADLGAVGDSDAVRLFVERAVSVDPDFELSVANTESVAQVCRRLDGLPLAIELAAARITSMTPADLARRLDRRFDTLAGGRRRAVQRHQTLRAAIDWSYELCSDGERRLLARLAVFAGGCTLEAVEAVCGTDPLSGGEVFDSLASLVGKHLVVAQRDQPETRYRLLETIREYGEDRLADHEETDQLRRRHAEYYCQLEAVLTDRLYGPDQLETSRRLVAERDNLLAAVNHAVDTAEADLALRIVRHAPAPGVQLGFALHLPVLAVIGLPGATSHDLYPYAVALSAIISSNNGELERVEGACQAALDAAHRLSSEREQRRVEFLVATARLLRFVAIGRWRESVAYGEQAARIALQDGREAAAAAALNGAAAGCTMSGDPDAGAALAGEALRLARAGGGPIIVGSCLVGLAGTLADREPRRARELLEEALALRGSLDIESVNEVTQATLIAARMGDWALTLQLADRSIRHIQWGGQRSWLAGILNVVGRARAEADAEAAARLQGAARHLAVQLSAARPATADASAATRAALPAGSSVITELRRQTSTLLRGVLGDERLHQLRSEGETMDSDKAASYALDAIARAQNPVQP